jgi:hypothetical protein
MKERWQDEGLRCHGQGTYDRDELGEFVAQREREKCYY